MFTPMEATVIVRSIQQNLLSASSIKLSSTFFAACYATVDREAVLKVFSSALKFFGQTPTLMSKLLDKVPIGEHSGLTQKIKQKIKSHRNSHRNRNDFNFHPNRNSNRNAQWPDAKN